MLLGIDISHYQENIDWQKVKTAGIQFAYIKASQGCAFQDPKLKQNCQGAQDVGIPFGLYHVFLANTGDSQLRNWIGAIGSIAPLAPQLPSWLDIEPGAVTEETADQALKLLGDSFPVVYCSPSTADFALTDPTFAKYSLAVAHYNVDQPRIPSMWKNWLFWQHTCAGTVDGIDTAVDLDWFNGDESALQTILRTM